MRLPRIALLDSTSEFLPQAARGLLSQHAQTLPDLSAVRVLLPHLGIGREWHAALFQQHGGALLAPRLYTLRSYAQQFGDTLPQQSALHCQLQLAQILSRYGHLFPGQDSSVLAADLHQLFEELSAAVPDLAANPEHFLARVRRGYGRELRLFSEEARWVHQLWTAWLQDLGTASPGLAYARQLGSALEREQGPLYLLGFDEFTPAERTALRGVLARDNIHLWLRGRSPGRDAQAQRRLCEQLGIEPEPVRPSKPVRLWLDALLAEGAAPSQRLRGLVPPPGLYIQAARNPEHEARMADVAIRRWLLAGKKNIAVISQNRRYARRLRALLERARVPLRDEAGWALSTSSAAAALTHWLDCIELNFHVTPLLALLRSHFFDAKAALSTDLDAFERALQNGRGKIFSGLKRLAELHESAARLLPPLQAAAQRLVLHAGSRPARHWCAALRLSLQELPLAKNLQADEAGAQLLTLLDELQAALESTGLQLDWPAFRRLLGRLMEQATFTPISSDSPVRLLTLEQARLLRCDALILAGAAAGVFPANNTAPTLFSQAVRLELGLPHRQEMQDRDLARFRDLLDAAPDILISYAPEDESETAQPSPWVELMLSAGVGGDAELAELAGSAQTEVAEPQGEWPALRRAPRPSAVPALLPEQISATGHQALVDCPYRFHASTALGLSAPQEPDAPYSRKDFGERVHAVLSHFTAPVVAHQRKETEGRMAEVAARIFAPDLRGRALTRAWLAEFHSLIPELVEWLITRRDNWPQALAEQNLLSSFSGRYALRGRVDRLERNTAGQHSVVDFKTGAAPKQSDIEIGEQVQATHYALLLENCTQIEYLQLKRDDFRRTTVEGAALQDAQQGVSQRLHQILNALDSAAGLPAHGDAATCARCEFSGLCRHGAWADD